MNMKVTCGKDYIICSKLNTSAMLWGSVIEDLKIHMVRQHRKASSLHHIIAMVETATCYIPTAENCAWHMVGSQLMFVE